MDRVVSKHLFNYRLNGLMDSEAVEFERVMREMISNNPELMAAIEIENSDDPSVDPLIAAQTWNVLMSMLTAKFDTKDISKCTHTELSVPIRDGNDFEVPVRLHTPLSLVKDKANAAIIYAHGGGCIASDAASYTGLLSHLAVQAGVVVFNVDYRLAPETRCPKNVLDFYCAVKHIKENAKHFGVDPLKIAISGDSGGGYIVCATMVMLAQKGEGDLVKLAIPSCPMLSDYCFSDQLSMTKEESADARSQQKIWKCIAEDFNVQRYDPLLFPSLASDDILQKFPPVCIFENEFDSYITEASRMAHRLRANGRLLELRVLPGATHMSSYVGTRLKDNMRDYKLVVEEYLL